MNFFGSVAARSADNDDLVLLIPFQDRARSYSEPLANFKWHRDLALSGQLGFSDSHATTLLG